MKGTLRAVGLNELLGGVRKMNVKLKFLFCLACYHICRLASEMILLLCPLSDT
jgi:hypothetical protein